MHLTQLRDLWVNVIQDMLYNRVPSKQFVLLQDRGEGLVVTKIEDYGNNRKKDLIVDAVYNNGKWEEINEGIKRMVEENLIIIGEDFNVRIGKEGDIIKGWGISRRSKDKIVNRKIFWT